MCGLQVSGYDMLSVFDYEIFSSWGKNPCDFGKRYTGVLRIFENVRNSNQKSLSKNQKNWIFESDFLHILSQEGIIKVENGFKNA